jgi:hypothetical protein
MAANAQLITRPAEVSGMIAGSEEDWYSFMLATSAFVTILLNGPTNPAAPTANIDLFLTDEPGTTQLALSQSPAFREAVADNLMAGTYKIRVKATNLGTPVPYTILIQ